MKRFTALLLTALLAAALFSACSAKTDEDIIADVPSVACACGDDKKVIVGASSTPHAEILEAAREVLAEEGYELEIHKFTDYVQPNLALSSKELDANYFQHLPYLENFNAEYKTNLVSAAAIHYEPLGIYAGKTKKLASLRSGAVVAVPNDATNEARALMLLESSGMIKLDPKAGLKATKESIISNPFNLSFREIEAAQLVRLLPEVDLAVINGNYAIQAGLNVQTDALAKEEINSLAAKTYANIVAVRAGTETYADIQAFIKALKSDKVKKFIEEKYKGSVLPVD